MYAQNLSAYADKHPPNSNKNLDIKVTDIVMEQAYDGMFWKI